MTEVILFVVVLCLDAFTASVAYGAQRIKIGLIPGFIIGVTGGLSLWVSALLSSLFSGFLSEMLCKSLGFVILFLIGFFNFIQGALKSAIRRKREHNANMHFKLHELDFFVEVLVDETKADADHSNALSVKEAFYLAVALSIDSFAAGISCGLGGMNPVELGFAAFAANLIAVLFGWLLGKGIARCFRLELSWLGGAVLIGLAFFRFLF